MESGDAASKSRRLKSFYRSLLRVLFVSFVVVFTCTILGWMVWLGFTQTDQGTNVAQVGWLPAAATNISYYRSYTNKAYEFDISQQSFLDWADRWNPQPITQPVRITTCQGFITPGNGSTSVEVSQGLAGSEEFGNGGGVWVAYDSSTGRAYFYSAPR